MLVWEMCDQMKMHGVNNIRFPRTVVAQWDFLKIPMGTQEEFLDVVNTICNLFIKLKRNVCFSKSSVSHHCHQ